MKNLFLGLFLFVTMTRCSAHSEDGVSSTCSYLTATYIKAPSAVRGWPVSLKCDYLIGDFLQHFSLEPMNDNFTIKLTCQMHLDGKLVHNVTESFNYDKSTFAGAPFTLQALEKNTTIEILVESRGFCGVTNVTLVPLEPTHMYDNTCEEANAKEIERNRVVSIDRTCDITALRLDCKSDSDDPALVPFVHQKNVTWYRNCVTMDPSEYTTLSPHVPGTVSSIRIEDEKKFISEFTCKITYNDLTRFFRFQRICVKPPASNRRAMVEPTQKTVYAKPGDDVILSCHGSGYAWAESSGPLASSWWYGRQFDADETNRLCEFHEIPKNETLNQKYVCDRQLGLHQSSATCIPSNRSCSSFNRFNSTLIIRNVAESDFGEYNCVARDSVVTTNATVLLKRTADSHPDTQLAVILSVIAAIIFIVMLCGAIVWYGSSRRNWFGKKYLVT